MEATCTSGEREPGGRQQNSLLYIVKKRPRYCAIIAGKQRVFHGCTSVAHRLSVAPTAQSILGRGICKPDLRVRPIRMANDTATRLLHRKRTAVWPRRLRESTVPLAGNTRSPHRGRFQAQGAATSDAPIALMFDANPAQFVPRKDREYKNRQQHDN